MVRWLDPVAEALDAAPAAVRVFFRDDDAGWSDDRLRVLLDRFAAHGLPLDLAVIPKALRGSLARELRARAGDRLALHQHGLAHANHEPEGRKFEFGPSRSRDAQRADIEAGRELLFERLGELVQPIFTPPWNRCTAETGEVLVELGFTALSRDRTAGRLGLPGLAELPIDVDWFATRRGRPLGREAVGAQLAAAVRAGGVIRSALPTLGNRE